MGGLRLRSLKWWSGSLARWLVSSISSSSLAPADIKQFLVTRDVAGHDTTVVEFGTDYGVAQDAYQAERKACGRRDLDVVLLSADSLETIKLTHSSYFESKSLDELLRACSQAESAVAMSGASQELGAENHSIGGAPGFHASVTLPPS